MAASYLRKADVAGVREFGEFEMALGSVSRFLSAAGAAACLAALAASPAFAGQQCYRHVVTPAVYGTVAEKVLVEPERVIARRIPAEYGLVSERVVVRPEKVVARHIPAEYGVVAETVMVRPGGKVWQVSRDAHGRTVGCWVDVPPAYATRHRKVVVRPASVVHETIPAIVKDVTRKVVVRPASVAHETIPAVYGVRHRKVMVAPATSGWQRIDGCAY
jgi:hypothetical protein